MPKGPRPQKVAPEIDKRLASYINMGSLMKLQEYFVATTNGFATLVKVANGEEINGKNPTIKEMLEAWKLMLDKSLPSLQASYVQQDYNVNPVAKAVDQAGLSQLKDELAMLEKDLGKIDNAKVPNGFPQV